TVDRSREVSMRDVVSEDVAEDQPVENQGEERQVNEAQVFPFGDQAPKATDFEGDPKSTEADEPDAVVDRIKPSAPRELDHGRAGEDIEGGKLDSGHLTFAGRIQGRRGPGEDSRPPRHVV